jgi:hypothetical protein
MPIILAARKVEITRITVLGQSGQKISETSISTNKLGIVAHACHPNYEGRLNRRIIVQAGLGLNARSYLKYNESKNQLGAWFK